MTRRLLIALGLIAASLYGIHLAIGFENFANLRGGAGAKPFENRDPSTAAGSGVQVGGLGGDRAAGGDPGSGAVSVSGRGPVDFRRDAEFPRPDGSVLFAPRWRLHAEDSETVQDDLLQLFDIDSEFLRCRYDAEADRVTSQVRGRIEAREALVVVGRNAEGVPSIREDREVDLFDVQLSTVAEAADPAARELRFDLARLLVRHQDGLLSFRSPTLFDTFQADLSGSDPAVLTGRGLRGSVPAEDPDATGELEAAPELVTLDVASDVHLETDVADLRSAGPLHYLEHLPTGRARLELRDAIRIQSDSSSRTLRLEVDEIDATLIRLSEDQAAQAADSPAILLEARLRAARGSLTDGEYRLEFQELVPYPGGGGPDALPWAVSATGSPSVTESPSATGSGTGRVLTSEGALHVAAVGLLHRQWIGRGFGLPALAWPRLLESRLRTRGPGRIESPTDELDLTATEGFEVLGDVNGAGQPMWLRAYGRVELQRTDLTFTSSSGLDVRRSSAREWLRTGLSADSRSEWTLRVELDTLGTLELAGTGRCEVERKSDGTLRLLVDGLGAPVLAKLGDELELRDVDRLEVVAEESKRLQSLLAVASPATGAPPCTVMWTRGDERLEGRAAKFVARQGFVRLEGESGAELTRFRKQAGGAARPERLRGGRIDIYGTDPRRGILEIRSYPDGRRASLSALALAGEETSDEAADPSEASEVELLAERIRILPGLLPRDAILWHGLSVPSDRLLAGDRLFADGAVHVERRRLTDGLVLASADSDRLESGAADARVLLHGAPATAMAIDLKQGRRLFGRANRMTLFFDPAGERGAMILDPLGDQLPELDIRSLDALTTHEVRTGEATASRAGAGSPAPSGPDSVRLSCDGQILATESGLEFGGSVALAELEPDSDEPLEGGMTLAAGDLDLEWDPQTRDLARATATDGADFRAVGMAASADRLDVDFRTWTCWLAGESRPVLVSMGGRQFRGAAFVVDYATQQLDAWNLQGGRE